jgi:transposase
MSKRFRSCDLNQPYLLPPALQDWLPADHLARFIGEVCEQLDLAGVYASYERRDGRGMAAYHPLMLTRLLLYAYCVGQPSSRRIETATYDELAFRYLSADQHPDHDTIAAFRQQHLPALAALFVQALRLCREAGLVKLGHVALDGTKVRAQASQRASLSYAQIVERERELERQVRRLLEQAATVDAEEDARYGPGRRGDELPAELATTEQRLAKLHEIKQRMEQQARDAAAQAEQERAAAGGKPRNEAEKKRWQRARRQAAAPAGSMNLSDPDSRVMKDGATGSFVQGYNAQAVVDAERQIIVASDVTPQPNDHAQMAPLVEQTQRNLAAQPETLTADAGYWSEESLAHAALAGIDVLVAPGSTNPRHAGRPLPANAPRSERAQRMRERLASAPGRALYALRKAIVEPVFAYIKERRGFRRFSLRGLPQVRAEWALICMTHNLLKLHRHRMALQIA